MELFINNSKGFFLDIPPMCRCICFEWIKWIIYLCKWGYLYSPSSCACQRSDIISRRFLGAFFPEAWASLEFLVSIWKAFRSRIWLISSISLKLGKATTFTSNTFRQVGCSNISLYSREVSLVFLVMEPLIHICWYCAGRFTWWW